MALQFSLCFQKRQAPHVTTCIGKLWLAACSARVSAAPLSKVSTTLFGATVAVAADPGLLPLPSSEDCVESSPDEEAELPAELSERGDALLLQRATDCCRGRLRRYRLRPKQPNRLARTLRRAGMTFPTLSQSWGDWRSGRARHRLTTLPLAPGKARRSSPKEGYGGG